MAERECRPGELICERYRIERVLGRGVLGEAYECTDTADGNGKVVMKVLRSMGSRAPDSFGADVARLTRVRHPGLARVMSFGTLPGGLAAFVIEEFLPGDNLLRATENSTIPEIVRILAEVCRALAYLHENGIAHRGLKPANGLIGDAGAGIGTVRLLHYGLLQLPLVPAQLACAGALVYMAPELLYGHPPDAATDLYALGVLTYQLLTRRLPFEDDDQGYLVQKHLQGRLDTRLLERLQGGPALAQIVRALLERDPDKRPSSAQEVLRLLRVATGSDLSTECHVPVDGYFVAAPFVGRSREMSLLQDRAAAVQRSGRGWTVFITGESGSGKSRCMEEFRVWGMLSGWRVLEASCSPGDRKAYAPYRHLLSNMDRLYPVSAGAANEVIFRFEDQPKPEAGPRFDTSSDSAAGQFRDSLTRELVRRLADRPTILFLHDFHWSDEATAAVLDYLSSDVTSQSVLVCVSLRSGAASAGAIGRVVEQCCRQARAEMVNLQPLTETDVRELIAGLTREPEIGALLSERLYHASGGNPFFLEETLKHLVDRGVLRRQAGKWHADSDSIDRLQPPAGIAVLIHERVHQLSAAASELARWLAVFQRSVSLDLLRLVAGCQVPALDAALAELLARHMVRTVDERGRARVEFRHPLMAEVVRTSIPVRRRRGMHLKIAQALEANFDGDKRVQELALHYTEARGGEKAVAYAIRAADLYRLEFANESALRLYDYVLHNPGTLNQQQRCEIAMQASDTCCALGMAKQGIRTIKSQVCRLGRGNALLKAQMLACLAIASRHSGDMKNMVAASNGGLKLLRNLPKSTATDRTKALLTVQFAFLALIEARPHQGITLVSSLIRKVQTDAYLTGMLQSILSALYRVDCRLREAVRAAAGSISTLKAANVLHYLPVAHSHLGAYLNALGRFRAAQKEHETAVVISNRTRSVFHQAQALSNLAECFCRSGELSNAVEITNNMMRLAESTGNRDWVNTCKGSAVETYILLGHYATAETLLRPIMQSRGTLPIYTRGQAVYLAAWLNQELGNFDIASRYLDQLAEYSSSHGAFYESELGEILRAQMYLWRGSIAEGIRLLAHVHRTVLSKAWAYQLCLCKIRLAEAFVMIREERRAEHHARGALKLARAMPARHLEAEARILVGKLLFDSEQISCGFSAAEQRSSVLHLKEATEIAERCGSLPLRFKAHHELASIEEKVGNAPSAYWHAKEALSALAELHRQAVGLSKATLLSVPERRIGSIECRRIITAYNPATANEDSSLLEDGQIRTLYRLSRILISTRSMDAVLDGILSHGTIAFGADKGFIALRQCEKDQLEVARATGWESNPIKPDLLMRDSILRDVFGSQKPFVSTDLSNDERVSNECSHLSQLGGRVLCGPMSICGRAIGLLLIAAQKSSQYLSDSQFSMFAALCNLAAVAIDNVMLQRQVAAEGPHSDDDTASSEAYPEIVGGGEAMSVLRRRITVAASCPLDIVISGESGTGKELVARAVYRNGSRSKGPFVAVDCGSLSDTLFEAELFGHRRGAFTGATETRVGLFEAASGGILFLDEVSNLPLKLQGKLLRALQEREVRRLGELLTRKVDVQVIAATNRDLREEVSRNRFREDLYFRLNVMQIRVPALRDRAEDIPLLAQFFLDTIIQVHAKQKKFSREAITALCRYEYPGNVRELKNIVEESYYSCGSNLIGVGDLPIVVTGICRTTHSQKGKQLLDVVKGNKGSFETTIKKPFLERQFGTDLLREVLQLALQESAGRYRDAFRLLKVPAREYASTMQFLKRHGCYLDFRLFRRAR